MATKQNNNLLFPLALLVLAILIFVVIFMNNSGKTSDNAYQSDIKQMQTVSASDEVEDIETDLDNTDLDKLDSELDDIDSLLQ